MFKIGNREFSQNGPLYFIADIGSNYDGQLDRAYRLIELAKEAGAHAAKFQNFKAHKIVSDYGFQALDGQKSHQAAWKKSTFEIYQDASISKDWTPLLKEKCNEVGIDYFTSPYDFDSVDEVDPYVDLYKIGSGDITWIEIIKYIANKNKPVLLACGASTFADVERAVMELQSKPGIQMVLMQCNTNYTASLENFKYINLNVLKLFADRFPDLILGLSDHTPGHATVLGALALGARFFEKHFTDDNDREGMDHKFAMNPKSWREMVDRANELYLALGDGIKRVEANEAETVIVQRRSLRFTRDLEMGHILTEEDLYPLRPCPQDAFPPYMIYELIGKTLQEPGKKEDSIQKRHIN